MRKNKTTEQFKLDVYELVGDEYTVVDEYINACTPIKIEHNSCGHIYDVKPTNFLRRSKCPKCFIPRNKKKTIEKFKAEVYSLVKDEYTVVGEYVNNKSYTKIKHNTCGNIYEVKPDNFLRGNRCPKCARKIMQKKTTDEFKEQVYKLVGNEYEVLGEYVSVGEHTEMKHNTCGLIYKVTPNNFLNSGTRCPKCSKKRNLK